MQTAEIIEQTAAKPLHLCPDGDLEAAWVSSRSRWRDDRWILDNPTPGSHPAVSTVTWAISLPGGSRLTEPQYADLLGWLRRFVWSLQVAPGSGQPLKPGSMCNLSVGITTFVSWMVEHGYRMPRELDCVAMQAFKDDLAALVADDKDGEGQSGCGVFYKPLHVPRLLWQQRRTLAKAGIAPMPREPFEGKSTLDLATAIATKAEGWIKPLPDEIAIPLLNKAAWFLATPATDILRLQSIYLAARNSDAVNCLNGYDPSKRRRWARQRKAAETFEFSVFDDGGVPWHAPLRLESVAGVELNVNQQVRRLVFAIRTACIIIIQAAGGMRISEICGLSAGADAGTGLPSCVRIERSATGLNELFIVRTLLSKTEEAPRNVDWVIGMRPYATTEIPLAVRALQILDQLLAPYRPLLMSNRYLSLSQMGPAYQ